MTKAIKHISAAALLFVFVLGVPATLNAQKKDGKGAAAAPVFGNVDSITARQLKEYLTFIASDELEGRDTPSKGLDIAAKYIAGHLASWGIKPAGGDGTVHRFQLALSGQGLAAVPQTGAALAFQRPAGAALRDAPTRVLTFTAELGDYYRTALAQPPAAGAT